jgi:hypothetical protein
MGNRAAKAKTMALLDLDMFNAFESIKIDAATASLAREKNEMGKTVVKTFGDIVSKVLNVPIIDPIVDLAVEAWDYFDDSEEVYLNPDDYKYGKNKVNEINRDFRDYDKVRKISDIMEFGVDQLQWYKDTGGYDSETGEWMPLWDTTDPLTGETVDGWFSSKEWKEYGLNEVNKLDNKLDLYPWLKDDDVGKEIADEIGLNDLVQREEINNVLNEVDLSDDQDIGYENVARFFNIDEEYYQSMPVWMQDYYKEQAQQELKQSLLEHKKTDIGRKPDINIPITDVGKEKELYSKFLGENASKRLDILSEQKELWDFIDDPVYAEELSWDMEKTYGSALTVEGEDFLVDKVGQEAYQIFAEEYILTTDSEFIKWWQSRREQGERWDDMLFDDKIKVFREYLKSVGRDKPRYPTEDSSYDDLFFNEFDIGGV